MNNIKTRFVIAISRKLSAAPDSEAKADLIEELSENLCGRYRDLVASGMPEEEAYATALEKLGDVDELLAYLDSCGGRPAAGEDPSGQGKAAEDWFDSLGDMIRQTVDQAVDAAADAAAMVREAARDFGGRRSSPRTGNGGEALAFPSEGLRGVNISIAGDLTVRLDDDPDAPVRLAGDMVDLSAVTGPDGVLAITQDRTAGVSFFFSRGLASDSNELTLPRRHWETLAITTIDGDVELRDGVLEAGTLTLKTTSGDVELEDLNARRVEVTTTSGDVSLTDCACGELALRSTSGDLEGKNITAAVLARTDSGDISLTGDIHALKAVSASGDLELDTRVFPEALELATKSGDCSARFPDNEGFLLRFSTVSGELDSDFPLAREAGARQSRIGHAGEAAYRDGGDGRVFSMSSVSGDIELRVR